MSVAATTDPVWAQEDTLSPELRALLACARAVLDRHRLGEFETALAACADADSLCKAAVAHGMLGHLHRLVSAETAGKVDPSLAGRLSEKQRLSAQRNLRQTGHLLRVLEKLEAAGVQAMPLKGPAWAERLYGDVTLRSWADLDILTPHRQVLQARDVLLANGFVDAGRFNAQIARKAKGRWGQIALSASDLGLHLELHWEITVGLSARSLRSDALFERAGSLDLLGREILTPSPVDLLLINCLNGARDRWDSVERMLGLAVQARDTASEQWPGIMAAARAAGCERRVTVGVAYVCRALGLSVPTEVAQALAGDAMGRALIRSLGPGTLDRDAPRGAGRHLALLFWRFATEDSLAAGVWHGTTRLFSPGPEDWEGLALPPRMAWLYYPLRPVRLAVKWAKQLF
jgi:Uncharacterised nucleotidyltransferase